MIEDDSRKIIEESKTKKVLIIVNTINKAISLYKELKNLGSDNINLLHSRYEQNDRSQKEDEIKAFSSRKEENGIWITTQIVEASLDIDFDVLYTEMSTLDSLFQRLGRCYRSREYTGEAPNVNIYINEASGIGYVYDKEIHQKSIEMLMEYDEQILSENTKIHLVDKLYSEDVLRGTNFYENFQSAIKILNNIMDYDTSQKEAQKVLRNIDNIEVIPKAIYDDNLELFNAYDMETDLMQKFKLKLEIDKLFISVSSSVKRTLKNYLTSCPYVKGKYIIDTKYSKEIGLLLEVDEEYSISSREL